MGSPDLLYTLADVRSAQNERLRVLGVYPCRAYHFNGRRRSTKRNILWDRLHQVHFRGRHGPAGTPSLNFGLSRLTVLANLNSHNRSAVQWYTRYTQDVLRSIAHFGEVEVEILVNVAIQDTLFFNNM